MARLQDEGHLPLLSAGSTKGTVHNVLLCFNVPVTYWQTRITRYLAWKQKTRRYVVNDSIIPLIIFPYLIFSLGNRLSVQYAQALQFPVVIYVQAQSLINRVRSIPSGELIIIVTKYVLDGQVCIGVFINLSSFSEGAATPCYR